MNDRLKRISDLFVEGTEVFLGNDPADDSPILVWVNKLNSFEREDALRDAAVRRAERMSELGPDSAEGHGVEVEMSLWSDDELREAIVRGEDDEVYLEALDNLQTDPVFRELEDHVRRAPELQADDDIRPDDPRMVTLAEKSQDYSDRLQGAVAKVTKRHLDDLAERDRPTLEKVFLEQWRKRRAFEEYVTARRMTEIYLASRDCRATRTEKLGEQRWDHSGCDHSVRMFSERASIRRCPERVIVLLANALNELSVNPRDAGNSDAPRSSSEPSEQSSVSEAPSTPSSPEPTPVAAPTT